MLTLAKKFFASIVTQSWRNKNFIWKQFSGLNQEIVMLWEIKVSAFYQAQILVEIFWTNLERPVPPRYANIAAGK